MVRTLYTYLGMQQITDARLTLNLAMQNAEEEFRQHAGLIRAATAMVVFSTLMMLVSAGVIIFASVTIQSPDGLGNTHAKDVQWHILGIGIFGILFFPILMCTYANWRIVGKMRRFGTQLRLDKARETYEHTTQSLPTTGIDECV